MMATRQPSQYEATILVLGAAKTGKTALIRQLTSSFLETNEQHATAEAPVYEQEYVIDSSPAAISVTIHYKEVSNLDAQSDNFFQPAQAIVVVYDPASRQSFDFAKECISDSHKKEQKLGKLHKPIFVIRNKKYPIENCEVSYREACDVFGGSEILSMCAQQPEGDTNFNELGKWLALSAVNSIKCEKHSQKLHQQQRIQKIAAIVLLALLVGLGIAVGVGVGAPALLAAASNVSAGITATGNITWSFVIANSVAVASLLSSAAYFLSVGRLHKFLFNHFTSFRHIQDEKWEIVYSKEYKILNTLLNLLRIVARIVIVISLSMLTYAAFPVTGALLAAKMATSASIIGNSLMSAGATVGAYLGSGIQAVSAFFNGHIFIDVPVTMQIIAGGIIGLAALGLGFMAVRVEDVSEEVISEAGKPKGSARSLLSRDTHRRVAERMNVGVENSSRVCHSPLINELDNSELSSNSDSSINMFKSIAGAIEEAKNKITKAATKGLHTFFSTSESASSKGNGERLEENLVRSNAENSMVGN